MIPVIDKFDFGNLVKSMHICPKTSLFVCLFSVICQC